MARANAAHAFARVDESTEMPSVFDLSPHWQRFRDHEPLLRRGAIAALTLFIASLLFATVVLIVHARDEAIADAMEDLDLYTTTVARTMASVGYEGEALAMLTVMLPHRVFSRGRRIHIADRSGTIIVSLPVGSVAPKSISALFGMAHPLAILAEKAGVMRVRLSDDADVIASVHNLEKEHGAGFAQIVMLQPMSEVLADWRSMAYRAALLLASTTVLLLGVGAAYWWQAKRSAAAEGDVEALRRRIDTALGSGRCGLWDWDIGRGRIYWSPSMYGMLGMAAGARYMSFGELSDMVHPADGDFIDIAERFAASDARSLDHMFRIRNGRGEWVWLRARAELVDGARGEGAHLVGIAVDITEQRELAERTALQDVRLRDAIETISEAFVLWDSNNSLALCNSKFRSLHGIPRDAMIAGLPYAQVMGIGAPPEIQSRIALRERIGARGHTYEAQLADGRWLQVNERRTGDGGYVSVGTDITTLKRHEEKLLDSERRLMASVADLRRSRQLLELQARELAVLAERYLEEKANAEFASRAKSEFLANMSHELRTPLNAILGFSEIMQSQVFGALGSERYVEYCDYIRGSGERLLAVITDVLDMSRLDAGQMPIERASFPLADMMTDSLRSILAVANEKRIAVEEEIAPSVLCFGDRSAVARSLATVLHNAVKFTPEKGRISVRLRGTGRRCVMTIADTGCGVPADCLARIGRPFEQFSLTMQDGMKGSGLGLAIASSLIKLHGGDLRIRSREGRGTVVRIRLPAIAA